MTDHDKHKGGERTAAQERGKVANPSATASTADRTGPGGRAVAEAPPAPTQVDPAIIAAATAAAVAAVERTRAGATATPNMDKTVSGGVYIVEGKVVDAWGNEREMPREGEDDKAGDDGAKDEGR